MVQQQKGLQWVAIAGLADQLPYMVVLQAAGNIPQVRPTLTVRHRQEQKRYSMPDFDAINCGLLPRVHSETKEKPDHDDDMLVCVYCDQSFHRNKLPQHMRKCDNLKQLANCYS